MWLLVPLAAADAPYSDILEGWYLRETGQLEAANQRALEALVLDPGDIGAHRLYVNLRIKGYGEGPEVVEQYRRWVQLSPDDPAARVGLANALMWSNRDMGPWCEELEELLEPLPEDPADRYWALRVQYETRRSCPGMTQAEAAEALLAHDAEHIGFLGYRLRVELSETKTVDATWASDLQAWYDAGAIDAGYPGDVWWEDYSGDGLEAAQEAMLAQARAQAASDDPVRVRNAMKVLGWADLDDERDAAEARLAELDPAVRQLESRYMGDRSWITRVEKAPGSHGYDIYKAQQKAPPARAIVALNALDDEIEASGPERADWYEYLGENQGYQLRRGAEYESVRLAWENDPTPDRANAFAYDAALRGEDLDLALSAMDAALADWGEWDPRGPYWVDGYDDWHEMQRRQLAKRLDTRAWVQVQRGDLGAARDDLQRAILVAPSPKGVYHLHMGLVLAELGLQEQALFHLGRGLALGSSEAKLVRHARSVGVDLFEATRWTHEDFDAWVAAQRPAEEIGLAPGVDQEKDYRIGMPFPDLALVVDGEDKHISDYEGVRVVDVWATWCGPCVSALPHVDDVAKDYADRGVTVLAVSVDSDHEDVLEFDDGPRKPAYVVAWTGDGGWAELRISAIPNVFVLDAEGNILDHWTGSGGTRLDRSLDRILDAQDVDAGEPEP